MSEGDGLSGIGFHQVIAHDLSLSGLLVVVSKRNSAGFLVKADTNCTLNQGQTASLAGVLSV